jgi:hypothetical protein
VTPFEFWYAWVLPFEHPLHQHVQRVLRRAARVYGHTPRLLDVGGRRSNYTIAVPAEVWLSDIPREKEIQRALDLGATDQIREKVLKRRSNVHSYIYDDMTATRLPAAHFDIVTAIEVLEHVDEDERFLQNVATVLKPGGMFLMTTPNGDFRPTPYPDHKRHYRASNLEAMLARHFANVRIEYRVNSDRLFQLGLRRPSLKAPFRTAFSLFGFGVGALLERAGFGGSGPAGKLHLVAVCTKAM